MLIVKKELLDLIYNLGYDNNKIFYYEKFDFILKLQEKHRTYNCYNFIEQLENVNLIEVDSNLKNNTLEIDVACNVNKTQKKWTKYTGQLYRFKLSTFK